MFRSHFTWKECSYECIASCIGLPMFFSGPNFWYGTLKNMGRPGNEANECYFKKIILWKYISCCSHLPLKVHWHSSASRSAWCCQVVAECLLSTDRSLHRVVALHSCICTHMLYYWGSVLLITKQKTVSIDTQTQIHRHTRMDIICSHRNLHTCMYTYIIYTHQCFI